MKEIILEFLEWMPNGIDDIFELMDKPKKVVDKYIKDTDKLNEFKSIKQTLTTDVDSESYIKCWNCKQFTQTTTNYANNEMGYCKLNNCEVSNPKWQKCGKYEQCGNFR